MPQFKKDPASSLERIFPGDCPGCADELELHDLYAQETARLAGTRFLFFSLRRAKNRHPLYREPSAEGQGWSFTGPYEMWGSLEYVPSDQSSTNVTSEGTEKESDSVMWVARKEFEDACAPEPKNGDVIEFWTLDEGPFAESRLQSQWDVVKASRDGYIFNSEKFVQIRFELKRRAKFLAVRKTENDRV
jgi:hypothetical protein